METIEIKSKYNVSVFKEEIKKLAEEQKFLKDQRKTVHIKGERKYEPWWATMKHAENTNKLRIMYAAYGIMRGKCFSQIENSHGEEDHPLNKFHDNIDKIINQYVNRE